MQEHVLERRAAHEDALRHESSLVQRVRRSVAVGRIQQDSIGQRLDALDDSVGPVAQSSGLLPSSKRSSTTSRVEYCSMSERGEPSATIFP